MRKIATVFIFLLLTTSTFAQISKTKITEKKNIISTKPYDSLKNFLESNVYGYVNQNLYLLEQSESLRKYGYRDFVVDYLLRDYYDKSNVYKGYGNHSSRYEDLNGRYFKVLGVHPHPRQEYDKLLYGKTFFLELEEQKTKDTVFFKYNAESENSFPFLVTGFYEKQKKMLVNKKFVFTNRILRVSSGSGLDITTGKPLTIKTGEKWTCIDLTVEEKYFSLSLVVRNSLGETTVVSYDSVFDDRKFAYTSEQAYRCITKFGSINFNLILQGLVKIGMTSEMCKLSLGEPIKINKTISAGRNSEQWVYEKNYLYFENNILTTIQ